jgi:deoxyribodipyrimidine photo-lyase
LKPFAATSLHQLIDDNTTLFWFRRDLRLRDNAGLYFCLKENTNVLPVFIFDTIILDRLDDKRDARVEFIHQSLDLLRQQLAAAGSTLLVVHTDPVTFFKQVKPKAVYANHDYESYGQTRDAAVQLILSAKGSCLKTFKDIVIFEKNEIVKNDGKPYTVFTPYSRKWKSSVHGAVVKSYRVERYLAGLKHLDPLPLPPLQGLGFSPALAVYPQRKINNELVSDYHNTRNYPAIKGTSRLSIHLRFGTVSVRKLVQTAIAKNETWLNELIWREFYHMILWHFPLVEHKAFKPAYDRIEWRNDPNEFQAWCEGRTGYPIVDAGMRELNATGFMHNRVRMIVASFLTKHLLIDWRWGESYFAKKLRDFDLAANNGGWQWAASCGCDAAPYFRIFNPALQVLKFDPERRYIRTWVPEFETGTYPTPLVAHDVARKRALKAYAKALEK